MRSEECRVLRTAIIIRRIFAPLYFALCILHFLKSACPKTFHFPFSTCNLKELVIKSQALYDVSHGNQRSLQREALQYELVRFQC